MKRESMPTAQKKFPISTLNESSEKALAISLKLIYSYQVKLAQEKWNQKKFQTNRFRLQMISLVLIRVENEKCFGSFDGLVT